MRHVKRRPDIEAVRLELPISGMEQEIMEAILQHDVVVLCGETGCGKTTQVIRWVAPRTFVLSCLTLTQLGQCGTCLGAMASAGSE